VAVGVEAVGLVVMPLAIMFLPMRWDVGAMALALAGGMVGGFGLVLFYRALALDLMGVVAPITAVIAAALPTVVGVAIGGERLHLGQGAGIVAGLLAIVLINGGGRTSRKGARQAVALALVAGVTFGMFFVLFHYASSAGVGAFASGRLGSGVVAVSYALITKVRVLPLRESWRLVGLAGTLDGVGLFLYMYATLYGLLSISAVLTSFYPACTILCARFLLNERLSALQASGAALAIIAAAAIAAA
jgi:drug/metabolite transporter (DMT)-like permease